jgi:hypothetical protein
MTRELTFSKAPRGLKAQGKFVDVEPRGPHGQDDPRHRPRGLQPILFYRAMGEQFDSFHWSNFDEVICNINIEKLHKKFLTMNAEEVVPGAPPQHSKFGANLTNGCHLCARCGAMPSAIR